MAQRLLDLYDTQGEESSLDGAHTAASQALSIVPVSDDQRVATLTCLGQVLLRRYRHRGDQSKLEESLTRSREALQLCSEDSETRPFVLSNVGEALLYQFFRNEKQETYQEAINLLREATWLLKPGNPRSSTVHFTLGTALVCRYSKETLSEDLDESISLFRQVLESASTSPFHQRPRAVTMLVSVLSIRSLIDNNPQALDEAVTLAREALASTQQQHPSRPGILTCLGLALYHQYQRVGGKAKLEEAHSQIDEACRTVLPGTLSLDELYGAAAAHLSLYQREDAREEVAQAISMWRQLTALTTPGGPLWTASMIKLGSALGRRHRIRGRKEDLAEAISGSEQLLQLMGASNPLRVTVLGNLGNQLLNRYYYDCIPEDVTRATAVFREALSAVDRQLPPIVKTRILSNLGRALWAGYGESSGQVSLLDEAVAVFRKAVNCAPTEYSSRTTLLINLASAMFSQYTTESLTEGIEICREALTEVHDDHPHRSVILDRLGMALGALTTKNLDALSTGVADNEAVARFEEAAIHFTDGSACVNSAAIDRLRACEDLAITAFQLAVPQLHVRVFKGLLDLLDLVVIRLSSLDDPFAQSIADACISRYQYQIVEGTIATILHGHVESGVEMFEHNRSIVLTQLGRYRISLDDVRAIDPELANQLVEVGEELEASAIPRSRENPLVSVSEDDLARSDRSLGSEWHALVTRVRHLPGLADFLKSTPFDALQKAAEHGPVIMVLVCNDLSCAVIIPREGSPHPVVCSDATLEAMNELVDRLTAATAVANSGNQEVLEVLRQLWKVMVGPIAKKLQELGTPKGSRVWWCPSSVASRLPLHAANPYKAREQGFSSLYISSYTPTLGALIRARQNNTPTVSAPSSLLVIEQLRAPGREEINRVGAEIEEIQRIVPETVLLDQQNCTRHTFLDAITQHPWVHLACHGHIDHEKPFKSHFSLHDGDVELPDIARTHLPDAKFAMLLECHAPTCDANTLGEPLHLAAGLQFAAFRGVVGTLWTMDDEDGLLLVKEFYKRMVDGEGRLLDHTKAAEALHAAVGVLRARRVPVARWINFVHFGA